MCSGDTRRAEIDDAAGAPLLPDVCWNAHRVAWHRLSAAEGRADALPGFQKYLRLPEPIRAR